MPKTLSIKRKKIIKTAAKVIKRGGTVVFPTETVYGIGADATNADAVNRIYLIKRRPRANPLIIHVSGIDMVRKYITTKIPQAATKLIKKFWPGPLTLIVKNTKKKIAPVVTAGLETVAVRSPSHTIARNLIKSAGVPIAAPSANISGRVSPTSYRHIIEDFYRRGVRARARVVLPDILIPGGRCSRGIESTIVDVSVFPPKILRHGAIPCEKIARVLNLKFSEMIDDKKHLSVSANKSEDTLAKNPLLLAPGMMKRHYRPRARVYLFPSESEMFLWLRGRKLSDLSGRGSNFFFIIGTLGLKARLEKMPSLLRRQLIGFGIFKNEKDLSRKLYSYLRKADNLGADIILASFLKNRGLGMAINDRLRRASSRIF